MTGKARAHIRRRVRAESRAEYIKLGRHILEQAFNNDGLSLTDKGLNGTLEKFAVDNLDDLYAKVGEGRLMGREVLVAVYPGARLGAEDNIVNLSQARLKQSSDAGDAIAIKGLTPGMSVHLGECCHPLPGDRIVGIAGGGHGIDIHAIDCDELESYADQPERWIDLAWDPERDKDVHIGRINLVVNNETGSLGELSTVIARNFGNISNLKIEKRAKDFFEMTLDIEVRGVKHLTNIIAFIEGRPISGL